MTMRANTYEHAVELAKSGDFAQAESLCDTLLKKEPGNYLVLYLNASIKLLTRRYEESRGLCERLLRIRQDNPDTYNIMAAISADFDLDNDAAESWLRRALACAPDHTKALVNLANARLRKQDHEEALALYNKVLALTGGEDADALNGLGMVAADKGEPEEAVTWYEKALQRNPDDRQFLTNLISTLYALKGEDRRAEALAIAERVAGMEAPGLAAVPAFASAKSHCLWHIADKLLPAALEELTRRIKNYHVFMLPNLALLSSYEVSNAELFTVHCRAGQSIRQARLAPPFSDHPIAFTPAPRIRVGYISPDMKSHVVSHFFRGLLNHRDRGRFEIFLYSNLPEKNEDDVTRQYRASADHFTPVAAMRDLELAERIRADGVQILVEMSGYTTGNRLGALSYRPAPVQISYMGYPYTYGIEEFDYHFSDPWLDGPKNAAYFVEKTLRLPQSFLAFGDFATQAINPEPPVLRNGYVTFGSLNNSYKLNRKTVELWSRILHQVAGSRLYLNHGNYDMPATRQAVMAEFAGHGIAAERITLVTAKHPGGSHLLYYNDFDIALDSLPLTGGTTTVETLWMGVPVITLAGEAHAQRMSYSIIKNVGIDLDDCIAFDENEYVARAVALAGNPERIQRLRADIPAALETSILRDTVRFTGQFEALLIEAWNVKFPATPLEGLLSSAVHTPLEVGGVRLVVNDTLRDQFAFILREQGGWYEPESRFLQTNARFFQVFWDYAEDPGVFALPVAAGQAEGSVTLALRNAGLAALLIEKSIRHNELVNLRVAPTPESDESLPDLVRFALDYNDGAGRRVEEALRLCDANAPLVLASLRDAAGGEDNSARAILEQHGYQPYRLLPGYGLLAPLGAEAPEPSDINLFFCKPERALILEKSGLLAMGQTDISPMPTPEDTLWATSIRAKPYATACLASWENEPVSGQWGDMYRLALNLDSLARDRAHAPGQRLACANMAASILVLLAQEEATAPRLLTGIRIMADLGKRAAALEWANILIGGIAGLNGHFLDEPFLPPLEAWEEKTISDNEAEWVLTLSRVTFERLRGFSSWFTADESLAFWQGLQDHPLPGDEPRRMVDLLRRKIAAEPGRISLMADI